MYGMAVAVCCVSLLSAGRCRGMRCCMCGCLVGILHGHGPAVGVAASATAGAQCMGMWWCAALTSEICNCRHACCMQATAVFSGITFLGVVC